MSQICQGKIFLSKAAILNLLNQDNKKTNKSALCLNPLSCQTLPLFKSTNAGIASFYLLVISVQEQMLQL